MSEMIQNNYISDQQAVSSSQTTATQTGTWDPTALSPIWADIEILGLCITLCVAELYSMGHYGDPKYTKINNDITNRLNRLATESQANPRFIQLAQNSVAVSESNDNFSEKAGEEGSLLKSFRENTDIPSSITALQMMGEFDKEDLYLPQDDGTALFCLTMVCGAIVLTEHKYGNNEYAKDLLAHPQLIAFPVASYEFLCNIYTPEVVKENANSYAHNNTLMLNTPVTRYLLNLWIDSGSPPVPPNANTASATEMWNSFVAQYQAPTPGDFPYNDDQEMPPYDPSAPDQMFDPYSQSGNDVLSKSYLWLQWLVIDPNHSTNDAEVFLLYLSNLAAAGYFDDNADGSECALAEGLLSIQNSDGKTLVAECVDITMLQMCMSGYTPEQADLTIHQLFPGDDPVSQAVCAEADAETAAIEDGSVVVPTSEEDLETQWSDYITDDSTVSSIDNAKTELRGGMIEESGNNIYVAIMVLLMLLDAAGQANLAAYGELSNELADATNQLNESINDWSSGEVTESPEDALEWMQNLQDLQDEMDSMPFDDTTMGIIDSNFDDINNQQAAILSNGEVEPLYVDSNGTTWVENSDGTYSEVTYDGTGDTNVSSSSGTPSSELTPLTIQDQAFGNGSYQANSYALQDSFQAFQCQPINSDDPTQGGFSAQGQAITMDLDNLTKPLTQQSNMVGTEMQQETSTIELYENTFSSILLDQLGDENSAIIGNV